MGAEALYQSQTVAMFIQVMGTKDVAAIFLTKRRSAGAVLVLKRTDG